MSLTVVFDIDDTVYLERDYVRSGFEAVGRLVSRNFGVRDFGQVCWDLFTDGVRGRIFDQAASVVGIEVSSDTMNTLVSEYRTHEPDITLAPDAESVLPRLAEAFACAAITDGPLESQSRKVMALGLERWMDPVVLTAALGPRSGKPALDAFELVQRRHRIDGARCVYVADNPAKDFQGPRQLGWQTVRIRRLQGLHSLMPSTPEIDVEINDLHELTGVLRKVL